MQTSFSPFPGDQRRLETLLVYMGAMKQDVEDVEWKTMQEKYEKALQALPVRISESLKKAIDLHWHSLTEELTLTDNPANNLEIPNWLLAELIDVPAFLPFFKLFPYFRNSSTNIGSRMKRDFLWQPCSFTKKPHGHTEMQWDCSEQFLREKLAAGDYLALAEKWLIVVSDYRSDGFQLAMAALLQYRKEGGDLSRNNVVFQMFNRSFSREHDYFYYPFVPRMIGCVERMFQSQYWTSVADMLPQNGVYYKKVEWSERIGKASEASKTVFDAMMNWIRDVCPQLEAASQKASRKGELVSNQTPKRRKVSFDEGLE